MMSRPPSTHSWPIAPYKGLSYYGPHDAPLFAGREEDIRQCANVIANRSTRLLVLHGATGCGKSSFLRAGLIPFLETGGGGFEFVKEGEQQKYKALFIRSTDRPLAKLAEVIYEFASEDVEINTVIGKETVKLASILSEYENRAEFLKAVVSDPKVMSKVLGAIAAVWPKTLVLVIDQGEEVLTLSLGEEGERFREEFFEFVSLFSKSKFDLKLLFALRTEFYGRFIDKCRRDLVDATNIRDYYLSNLTKAQLISAITRPTAREDIPGYGKPYDYYKFSFESGLPEAIADNLQIAGLAGGTLSVMQIVCASLYHALRAKEGYGKVIAKGDYMSLGGVEGQLGKHLERVLEQLCKENNVPNRKISEEIERWKKILSDLAKNQVDGTVTTEILRADVLQKKVEASGCKVSFQKAIAYLCDDERRVLRHVEVANIRSGELIHCYSLGQDAIGLVLKRWAVEYQKTNALNLRRRLVLIGLAAVLLLLGTVLWIVPRVETIGQVVLFISIPIWLLALMPRHYLEKILALLESLPRSIYSPNKSRESLTEDGTYDRFAKNMAFVWVAMFALVGTFGILQTPWFISVLPRPNMATIRAAIDADRQIQRQISAQYSAQTGKEPPSGIVYSSLFNGTEQRMLENAMASLMNDKYLQSELKKTFEVSFEEINAVVVPAWAISNVANNNQLGITSKGWMLAKEERFNSPGITLRDRAGDPQVTIDGRPIIALNPWAFRSMESLRQALFHEMFHAMNVPGYYQSRLTFTQTDLDYLPQYRDLVRRLGLQDREYLIWIAWVILPWSSFLLLVVRIYQGPKSAFAGLQLQKGKTVDSVKDSFPPQP